MINAEDLVTKIEQLVQEHISELRRSTSAAVERAFALPVASMKGKTRTPTPRLSSTRRDSEEVAALAERLHAAVSTSPGETMAVLAERVGVPTRELNLPMNKLRRAGRLRSAGVRNQTRYFPAVGPTAAASG